MGHSRVCVLDGGFPAWQSSNRPCTEIQTFSGDEGNFKAEFQPQLFADTQQIQNQIRDLDTSTAEPFAIVDARNRGRFTATTPEPRAGLRGGRIPGSQNLPIAEIVKDGKMLPVDQLESIYAELNIADQKTVFT